MKNIVITGATGSIGKAAAKALAAKKDVRLILAGRNAAKLKSLSEELKQVNPGLNTDIIEMDLNNTASVKNAAASIQSKYDQIHGLVNVAAVYKQQKTLNPQGHETMFSTNHLGPFALTSSLLNTIKKTPGARVLTVSAPSSTKIDFENLNGEKKFSALGAFGASKMMNLMFAFKLAKELEKSGQASMAFHPGLVKSDLLNEGPSFLRGFLKLISSGPDKTAAAIADLVTSDKKDLNGKFFNKSQKELKAAAHAYDPNQQQRLWDLSQKITGTALS